MDYIPSTFLSSASDILGDTDDGLSGSEIIKAMNGYAFDFDVEIPHSTIPIRANNKRTALLENLWCFEPEQQYKIIREFCDHPKFKSPKPDNLNNLKIQLIARYGDNFGSASEETLNLSLVEDLKHWLFEYPESENVYNSALSKFNNGVFQRNL